MWRVSRFENASGFAFAAVAGFLTGIWLVHSAATYGGIPMRSKLTKATGNVTWASLRTRKRPGISFRLADAKRTFLYSQNGGELEEVLSAIQYGGFGEPLTVLYDAESPRRSSFGNEEFFEVYEISKGNESIRGWTDVDREWHRTKRIMGWIGAGSIAASAALGLHAIGLKRRGKART